jgi:hypothetical protein
MEKIYIAGPMSDMPDFNFPAFYAAEEKLRRTGCKMVFNPARQGADIPYREALAVDLQWICNHADAIALLPGWRESKGATAERAVAMALGLSVIEL